MSAALKTAVVQHALDVAQIYKDNATLTRGLPQALPRLHVNDEPAPAQPVIQTVTAPVSAPVVAQPIPSSWLKPALLSAATLLGGAGIGGLTAWALKDGDTSSTTVIEQPADSSLLQHLEDEGFHLPPEKRGAK